MRPYRKEKVASVIRQVIGEAIVHRLNDPRVAPLTTVMRVEVTGDLLIARVYLSVQGDQAAEQRTLRAMRHAAGYIQRMLARRLPIRQCPELRFEIDEGIKGARRTMELLAENRRSEPELFEPQGNHDPPAHDDVHRLDGPNGG
ncbi:MAG: 30S ribosome-binding factor RbfA [Phycisphaerales bacterium]|nr:MAG: 30S ribosome-binding factor RbfA [Phycisphaerales bacterium]